MKIQNKPDYLIFADDAKTGELESFPNILRGWGITIDQTQSKPPMEWMNGVFHRIDENTLYLLQQGVPEWDSNVLYPVDAVIKYKSKLYIATVQNDNAIPSTNTTKWSKVVPDIIDASITQKGVVKLNSAINSTSTTEAATPSAVKTAYDLANTDATTSVKGRVQLNSAINSIAENQAATPKAVKIAYDLANTDATTSVKGRVQLNSAINSVLETQAATPKAVKVAYDLANSRLPLTGGTVTGNTNFTGKLQQSGIDVLTVLSMTKYLNTYIGEIRFFPFRASELPKGWYFANGQTHILTSDVGKVLNSLSINYKLDWKITVTNNRINLPNLFHSDGRGVFLRAIDGTSREVGSIELDELRSHNHDIVYYTQNGSEGAYDAMDKRRTASSNKRYDVSSKARGGSETRSLNIGMIPAIYLGV